MFRITPTGIETVLHFFSGSGGISDSLDGAGPIAGCEIQTYGNFYGTTAAGGEFNRGAVFKITPSGLASILHSFGQNPRSDGATPGASLVQSSDGSLYGTGNLKGSLGGQRIQAVGNCLLNWIAPDMLAFGADWRTAVTKNLMRGSRGKHGN